MEKPRRFLLIDDDPSNNLICKIIIQRTLEGQEVLEFTNPEKALEYIEQEYTKAPVPTIILLDINMPELSGWEVLEIMKGYSDEVMANFKIYILSSSVDNSDYEKATNDPRIIAYLTKPLVAQKLKEAYDLL